MLKRTSALLPADTRLGKCPWMHFGVRSRVCQPYVLRRCQVVGDFHSGSNNTLVTYWSVDFTLLFEYPYFWQTFSGQKFGGEFCYRRRLGGLHLSVSLSKISDGIMLACRWYRFAKFDSEKMKSKLSFLTTLRSTGQPKYAVEDKDNIAVTNCTCWLSVLD